MTVASSVASGYVTLLSLDEQLRVTEDTLKSREQAFKLATDSIRQATAPGWS
jgi:outer membrane protein TolC